MQAKIRVVGAEKLPDLTDLGWEHVSESRSILYPHPQPLSQKEGEGSCDFRFPFSHNWEKGLGDDSVSVSEALA